MISQLKYLKNVKTCLAKPLGIMINLSFSMGQFPDELKLAKVIPLYKKKEQILTSNYRPISILSYISKLNRKNQCLRDYITF